MCESGHPQRVRVQGQVWREKASRRGYRVLIVLEMAPRTAMWRCPGSQRGPLRLTTRAVSRRGIWHGGYRKRKGRQSHIFGLGRVVEATHASLLGVFVGAAGCGDGSVGAARVLVEGATSSTGVVSCVILAFTLAAAFSRLRAFRARFRSFSPTFSPSTSTPSTAFFPSTVVPSPARTNPPGTTESPPASSAEAFSLLSIISYSLFCLHATSAPPSLLPPIPSKSSFFATGMCARRPSPDTPKPAPEPAVHPNFSRYCSPKRESSTRVFFWSVYNWPGRGAVGVRMREISMKVDAPFAHARFRGSAGSLCFVLRSERPIEGLCGRRIFWLENRKDLEILWLV
jgi:hypothetical protein